MMDLVIEQMKWEDALHKDDPIDTAALRSMYPELGFVFDCVERLEQTVVSLKQELYECRMM